jgi:hypothetical protein
MILKANIKNKARRKNTTYNIPVHFGIKGNMTLPATKYARK